MYLHRNPSDSMSYINCCTFPGRQMTYSGRARTPRPDAIWNKSPSECGRRTSYPEMLHRHLQVPNGNPQSASSRYKERFPITTTEIHVLALPAVPDSDRHRLPLQPQRSTQGTLCDS